MKRKLCVFGGSKSGLNTKNEENAQLVGQMIAESNFDIIYGGGEKGIMGAVASSGISFGAKTTGIIPKFLMSKDIVKSYLPNHFNSELILTETMHERKKLM